MAVRTVTGRFLRGDGTPLSGVVDFAPTGRVIDADGIVLADPIRVPLEADGTFSVSLLTTDTGVPEGWLWKVREDVPGGSTWFLEVPDGASPLDVRDVSPIDQAPTGLQYPGPVGPVGPVGPTGPAGPMPPSSFRIKPIAGRYVTLGGARTTGAPTRDQLRGFPVWLDAGSLDRIGCEVVTPGGTGCVVRLGIYTGGDFPATRLLDAGVIDGTVTGAQEITISQTIASSGVYWLVAAVQGSDTLPNVRTFGSSPLEQLDMGTALAGALANTPAGFGFTMRRTAISGALPTSGTAANWSNQAAWSGTPVVAVRYASVT